LERNSIDCSETDVSPSTWSSAAATTGAATTGVVETETGSTVVAGTLFGAFVFFSVTGAATAAALLTTGAVAVAVDSVVLVFLGILLYYI
jgi:hypothetical protein